MNASQVPVRTGGFRPKEYAHVVFRTGQPQVLIDWYCKVLGLQVVLRNPNITFLTWDDSQDRMAIVTAPPGMPRVKGTVGVHHVAFSVASLAELTRHYRDLKQADIEPESCWNHGVATSMYFRDPDGNQIELSVEAFADVAALNAWLATGAFDANPIGVALQPEDVCRRIEGGEPEHDVLRPDPRHGERLAEAIFLMQAADARAASAQ